MPQMATSTPGGPARHEAIEDEVRRTAILSLSDELLVQIFCSIANPQSLAISCSRIYNISKDPWTRSKYFMQHGPVFAFYHALQRGNLLTPRAIDIMISSGAKMSRYLIQSIIGHYTKGNSVTRTRWCRSLRFSSFAHFCQIGADRYGDDVDIGKNNDDATTVSRYIDAKKSGIPSDSLDENWLTVREIFERFHFIPFDFKDPAMRDFPNWVSIEPRLLPLARRNGFGILDDFREVVLRKIFLASMRSVGDSGPDSLARLVLELTALDPEIFLTRTVAGEIIMERANNPSGFATLQRLHSANGLRFDLPTLVHDLLRLLNNNFVLMSEDVVHIAHSLYRDYPAPTDSDIRSMMILSIFTQAKLALEAQLPFDYSPEQKKRILDARSEASAKITKQLKDFDLLPLRKLDFMSVIGSRITRTERPVFNYLLKTAKTFGITNRDMEAMAETASLSALTDRWKGSMIKDLVEQYPQLIIPLRQAIARFAIDPDDVVLKSKGDGHFWFCMNSLPAPHIGDLDRKETATNDLGQLGLGSLTGGRAQHIRDQINAAYGAATKYTVCQWILERFGARSREAAIVFPHLFLDGYCTDFSECIRHGVPVTLKHFKLMRALGQEAPTALWDIIEYQDFYATEDDYLEPDSPSNLVDLVDDDDDRPTKRPRRHAAQSVPTYIADGVPEVIDVDAQTAPKPDPVDVEARDNFFAITVSVGAGWGATQTMTEETKQRTLRHAEQLQLWTKHLSNILHYEAKENKMRKKETIKKNNGNRAVRTPKTASHLELLKRIPRLRALEKNLRASLAPSLSGEGRASVEVTEEKDNDEEYVAPRERPNRPRMKRARA